MSDEARLLRHLLDQYDKMGTSSRPTYNSSVPTEVHFGIRLIQLDVDEKNQLLKTSAWLRMVSFSIESRQQYYEVNPYNLSVPSFE